MQVLIVGNGAVGKSSMIQRYCKGFFTNEYKKTIGVDFLDKKIKWVGLCAGRRERCLFHGAFAGL
jgi:Ras-related protein Rab-23